MKKNFTILCAMLLMGSVAAIAQPLKIGIKGGINTGKYVMTPIAINGASITGETTGLGYQFGVVARLSIPKFLQIQPELVYSSRDYRYALRSRDGKRDVKMQSRRLELPVMIGFNISALRLYAGPNFILSSSVKSSDKSVPLTVNYVKSDIAFQAGAGLDIKKFFLDVRYSTYLGSRYEKFTYEGITQKVKIKTDNQWFFSAGFFF